MISKLISLVTRGGGYVGRHPQLVMTFVLVLIVPLAFLLSGQQFLNAARENQERLEKDRIGLLHDVFTSFIHAASYDPALIQLELKKLAVENLDIVSFNIAVEEQGSIKIIASLDTTTIGTTIENELPYRIAYTNPNESLITPFAAHGVRYWQSMKLVHGVDGETYFISTETSLLHIDTLFASRIMTAYYWLFGIIVIVLFLIIRHVRLIDYAYLYQETKRASETKDMFTNMVAHELRAPLTAIRGYASLIREKKQIDSETRTQASRIESSAERLVTIVSDLLDIARLQSGKMNIVKKDTDVGSVIAGVVEAIQISAHEKNIVITAEGINAEVLITTDEKRLFQILTNVMSNAIKYTERGSIVVALESRSDRIEIRVKDTGMGISAENQKKLFAPFYRVNSKEVEQVTGTGLGMWITKELVELMGGSIGVESIKGVGTQVVLTLPR